MSLNSKHYFYSAHLAWAPPSVVSPSTPLFRNTTHCVSPFFRHEPINAPLPKHTPCVSPSFFPLAHHSTPLFPNTTPCSVPLFPANSPNNHPLPKHHPYMTPSFLISPSVPQSKTQPPYVLMHCLFKEAISSRSEQTFNRAWNWCPSLSWTQWLTITGSFMQQQRLYDFISTPIPWPVDRDDIVPSIFHK